MPITHDYINTSGFKPTPAECGQAELVPNLSDKTIWTKNTNNTVVKIGAGDASGLDYNNINSGLSATNVKDAIDEIASSSGTVQTVDNFFLRAL